MGPRSPYSTSPEFRLCPIHLRHHVLMPDIRSHVNLSRTSRYSMLNVVDRKGTRLALDEEVLTVTTATGERTFLLGFSSDKSACKFTCNRP